MKRIFIIFIIFIFSSCSFRERAVIIWNLSNTNKIFKNGEEVLVKKFKDSIQRDKIILIKINNNKAEKQNIIDAEYNNSLLVGLALKTQTKKNEKKIKQQIEDKYYKTGVEFFASDFIIKSEKNIKKETEFHSMDAFLKENYDYLKGEPNFKIGVPVFRNPEDKTSKFYYLNREDDVRVLYKKELRNSELEYGGTSWLYVVLKNGTEGFVNANYIYFNTGRKKSNFAEDPVLKEILDTSFRTPDFKKMLDLNQYDFTRFDPKYKLYIDSDEQVIILKTKDLDYYSPFEEIDYVTLQNGISYDFFGIGFKILYSNGLLTAIFEDKDRRFHEVKFVKTELSEQEVDKKYNEEVERRKSILDFILKKEDAKIFNSINYGLLEIFKNGEFKWSGGSGTYSNMNTIQDNKTGTINFNTYLPIFLQNEYYGVISFLFANNYEAKFLFRIRDAEDKKSMKDSLELVLIPNKYVGDNIIKSMPINPIRMYFLRK